MCEEEKYLRKIISDVVYDKDLFKIFVGTDKYIVGCVYTNNEDDGLYIYRTLYDSIVDLDIKIKKSFDMALHWEYKLDIKDFRMLSSLSNEEKEVIYYTENAVFRTSVLWDLLAQLYNVRFNNNKNPDKVYYHKLFHNGTQGKVPNDIAQAIYSYLTEEEPEDYVYEENEFWKGNHKYIVDYRNKMTHRNSPNIVTVSSYDITFPPYMRYVLKRAIEDYKKSSEFVRLMLGNIVDYLKKAQYKSI